MTDSFATAIFVDVVDRGLLRLLEKESASPIPFFHLQRDSAMERKRDVRFRLALLWVILLSIVLIPFFIFGEELSRWILATVNDCSDNRPAVALVLFAILASDIFLPIPSCLLSTLCAMFLGPWLGFAVSFAAMGASSAVGYFIGRAGSPLALKLIRGSEVRLDACSAQHGAFYLFIMRPVPVIAECSVVYAGLCRVSAMSAAFWIGLGNAVVSAVYATIGTMGVATDSPLPAFGGTAILCVIFWMVGRLKIFKAGRRKHDDN